MKRLAAWPGQGPDRCEENMLPVPAGKSEFFNSDTHANLINCIHGLFKCKINNVTHTNKRNKIKKPILSVVTRRNYPEKREPRVQTYKMIPRIENKLWLLQVKITFLEMIAHFSIFRFPFFFCVCQYLFCVSVTNNAKAVMVRACWDVNALNFRLLMPSIDLWLIALPIRVAKKAMQRKVPNSLFQAEYYIKMF